MEGMTTEERFTKIENSIASLIESQFRQEAEIEKQNAGIRDLIVINRAVVESQKQTNEQIQDVSSQIRELTGKVNQLTDNIEKLIQGRGPNGQQK
jgi:chromosome segregation ATPase